MPGWEVVGTEEWEEVERIFTSNKGVAFAHGFDGMRSRYCVRDMERIVCKVTGADYCQAVSSGSAGLYCALRALGVGPGDEVITSAFTFIATIEAILLCGATPVCVDIDTSLNLNPKKVEQAITPRSRVIMPVHMAGAPADMPAIMAVAERHGLKVVEDACQALGAHIADKWVGTIGDIGVYSLDAGKVVQCGEGGLIVTNDRQLYERARMVHDHGHDYNGPSRATEIPRMAGFNFRMSELQAAYALAQLNKLQYILNAQTLNKEMLRCAGVEEGRTMHGHEACDAVVQIYGSTNRAAEVVTRMKAVGLGTKNIPDALIWHCAAYWTHIWPYAAECYADTLHLLQKCVAIPVPVKMATEYPAQVAKALR